jgi:dihydropteroate synthase
LKAIRRDFPDVVLSVDTFRAGVAEYAVREFGVNMINDISSGLLDKDMIPVAATLRVPYIMMHMRGTPQNMQKDLFYKDITRELMAFFAERIAVAKEAGIDDLILDPGFGFAKSEDDNYRLLNELGLLRLLGFPVMAGLSRKSMIYKPLQINAAEAINGTTALNMLALNNGAALLRVHDVKEAMQAKLLYCLYQKSVKHSDKI